jgi:hypothetical protein
MTTSFSLRLYLLIFCTIAFKNLSVSQTFYGTNSFTEYRQGTLPILLTAPHGGTMVPLSIPNRTCNGSVTAPDMYTEELACEIDSSLFDLTGCHAHLVLCHLARIKVDVNRPVSIASCGNTLATIVFNEFHKFIDTAQFKMKQQHNYGFYADIHGHSHSIQRLELGYGLDTTQLALSPSSLNTPANVNSSSIRNLVNTNFNSYTLSDLLSGPFALGTLLASSGYSAVPSAQDPYPLGGQPYFTGGYNIQVHSSMVASNIIDAVQIETQYNGVRDNPISRKKFADTLAKKLLYFLNLHYNQPTPNCIVTTLKENENETHPLFFFDNTNKTLNIRFQTEGEHTIFIYGTSGDFWKKFTFKERNEELKLHDLSPGIYFIKGSGSLSGKFIIQ